MLTVVGTDRYDKIQPNFNFCPSCKRLLNEKVGVMKISHMSQQKQKETILNESVKEIVAAEALAETIALEKNIRLPDEVNMMGLICPP